MPNGKVKIWKPKEINSEWWVYFGTKKLPNGNTSYYGERARELKTGDFATTRKHAKIWALIKTGHEAGNLISDIDHYLLDIGISDDDNPAGWRC